MFELKQLRSWPPGSNNYKIWKIFICWRTLNKNPIEKTLVSILQSRNVASLRAPLSYRVTRLRSFYASEIRLLVLVFRVLLDWRPLGIIVSLRNRMAGRRGRQNTCAWQKWQARTITYVFCRDIHLALTFTSVYKKISFKGEWSLAKNCFKQKLLSRLLHKVCRLLSSPVRLLLITQQYGRGKKKANLV